MKQNRFCICISGLDGTGKSYIAEKLLKHYENKYEINHVWSRYKNYTSKPLLLFTRFIGLNYKEKKNNIIIGYHDFNNSKIISFLFLFFQWIDQIVEILIKFKFSNKNIISDRSLIDTLVDLSIDTKLEKIIFNFYGKSLLRFMPKNTYYFILKRDLEKIKKVRQDVFYDKNINRRIELFNEISKIFPVVVIENNFDAKNVVNAIVSRVDKR